MYRPCLLAVTAVTTPVSVFVTVTLAPARTAPDESITTPEMVPVPTCAASLTVKILVKRNASRNTVRSIASPPAVLTLAPCDRQYNILTPHILLHIPRAGHSLNLPSNRDQTSPRQIFVATLLQATRTRTLRPYCL